LRLVGAIAGQMEGWQVKIAETAWQNTIYRSGWWPVYSSVNRYIAGYKFCAQKLIQLLSPGPATHETSLRQQNVRTINKVKLSQHQALFIIFQVAGGCGIGALDRRSEQGLWPLASCRSKALRWRE